MSSDTPKMSMHSLPHRRNRAVRVSAMYSGQAGKRDRGGLGWAERGWAGWVGLGWEGWLGWVRAMGGFGWAERVFSGWAGRMGGLIVPASRTAARRRPRGSGRAAPCMSACVPLRQGTVSPRRDVAWSTLHPLLSLLFCALALSFSLSLSRSRARSLVLRSMSVSAAHLSEPLNVRRLQSSDDPPPCRLRQRQQARHRFSKRIPSRNRPNVPPTV